MRKLGIHLTSDDTLPLSPILFVRPLPSPQVLGPQTSLHVFKQAVYCHLRSSVLSGLRVWNPIPPEFCMLPLSCHFFLSWLCVPLRTATSSLRPYLTTHLILYSTPACSRPAHSGLLHSFCHCPDSPTQCQSPTLRCELPKNKACPPGSRLCPKLYSGAWLLLDTQASEQVRLWWTFTQAGERGPG